MSEKIVLGTRVKINYKDGVKGTVVKIPNNDEVIVYVDDLSATYTFDRDGLEVFVQPQVTRVITRTRLLDVMNDLGVGADWYKPGNQCVTAEVRGKSFDNAGFWDDDSAGEDHEELHVVLKQDGEPVATVNLATLFAWATGYIDN